jgi:predicted metal-binding protein
MFSRHGNHQVFALGTPHVLNQRGRDLDFIQSNDGQKNDITAAKPSVTIFVCASCRASEGSTEEPRQGTHLLNATMGAAAEQTPNITIKSVNCLSNCKRGPSAVIARQDGWTYVFGHLTLENATDLITGAELIATSADGLMPWKGRPDCLKRNMIARIPPFDFNA